MMQKYNLIIFLPESSSSWILLFFFASSLKLFFTLLLWWFYPRMNIDCIECEWVWEYDSDIGEWDKMSESKSEQGEGFIELWFSCEITIKCSWNSQLIIKFTILLGLNKFVWVSWNCNSHEMLMKFNWNEYLLRYFCRMLLSRKNLC